MKSGMGIYHVALKVLFRKGNDFLFLRDSVWGRWDLPGGRINRSEGRTPFKEIVEREVREELGPYVRYELGKTVIQYRRHVGKRQVPSFHNVYQARYLSGVIRLSSEHTGYRWINPKKTRLREKDFFGKEEYIAFKNYFFTLV